VATVSAPTAEELVPVASSASVEAEDGLVEVGYSGQMNTPDAAHDVTLHQPHVMDAALQMAPR
jgi:hypothetical protein